MEITRGCLLGFDVVKIKFGPPIMSRDIADIEITLRSTKVVASICVYVTIESNNKCSARSYPNLSNTISDLARKAIQISMIKLVTQIMENIGDV